MQKILVALTAAAVVIACAIPARVHADTYWSDYQTLLNVFRAGDGGPEMDISVKALARVMDGLAGKWAPLYALAPRIGDDEGIRKACDFMHFEASQQSPFSFLLVRKNTRKPEQILEYEFTFVESTAFQRHVDASAYLKFIGLDKAETPIERQITALRFVNAMVDVYRPAKDFLVVKPMLGPTEIFGRCR